jgi:hypothetical protein
MRLHVHALNIKVFSLLIFNAVCIGSCLPTFGENLSVQPEIVKQALFDCLNLRDCTDGLSRNVGIQLSAYAV